jgi:hypothetical protein
MFFCQGTETVLYKQTVMQKEHPSSQLLKSSIRLHQVGLDGGTHAAALVADR